MNAKDPTQSQPIDIEDIMLMIPVQRKNEVAEMRHNQIRQAIKQLVAQSRIDELEHIQLEYGGRFVATTYIDGDGQTITARIADLKEATNRQENDNG